MDKVPENHKQWMAQWRAAAEALQLQKMAELAELSEHDARIATENVLALVTHANLNPRRWAYSGLVEQQRWFHAREFL